MLVHETVEASILEMFTWPSGDFSFDVRTELEGDDPVLCLDQGMNAQYLAMEGLRLRDERCRDDTDDLSTDPDAETSPRIGLDQDPLFGDEPLEIDEEPVGTAADVLAASAVDRADPMLTLEEVEAALPLGPEIEIEGEPFDAVLIDASAEPEMETSEPIEVLPADDAFEALVASEVEVSQPEPSPPAAPGKCRFNCPSRGHGRRATPRHGRADAVF